MINYLGLRVKTTTTMLHDYLYCKILLLVHGSAKYFVWFIDLCPGHTV